MLDKKDIKPDYFCDNNKSKAGKTFLGVKILSFDELCNMGKDINIFITSQYIDEIYKQLIEQGFKNIYFIRNFYQLAIKEYFQVDYIKENRSKIEKLYRLLDDQSSKENLINLIKHRLTGDLKYTDKASKVNYYLNVDAFPEMNIDRNIYTPWNEVYFIEDDIIKISSDEVFIDAGAYVGDTAVAFANKVHGNFDKVYCFEPDAKNFKVLKENIKRFGYENRMIPINAGMSNKNGEISFYDNGKMVSTENILHHNNDIIKQELNVVKLDDCLRDTKITYIKMDIEGAEFEALEGAKFLISKYKPKLAICIYHKPTDLWELPLYIHKLLPEYKLYIRHYPKKGTFETVCYATL